LPRDEWRFEFGKCQETRQEDETVFRSAIPAISTTGGHIPDRAIRAWSFPELS
jgi:hypothetical protein